MGFKMRSISLLLLLVAVASASEESLKKSIESLTRQVMMNELYLEERIRSSGDSGIKIMRYNNVGNRPYHQATHTLQRMMAIHDHSNYRDTAGLGEFIAVLNGQEFRTRHNDYKIRMPCKLSKEWNCLEDIPFPQVPKSVSDKKDIHDQINEMREYFKAFQTQNITHRDYRPHFKPLLCYLEGFWTVGGNGNIEEPFSSDRHAIEAQNWFDLTEKIRFTGYSGRKSTLENFAFLPTKIMGLAEDGLPILSQWNYRIACAPMKGQVPLKTLHTVDDLGARMAYKLTMTEHSKRRGARFELSPEEDGKNDDKFYRTLPFLDKLMIQIPGRDNYPGYITDDAFGEAAFEIDDTTKKLNTARYHRFYKIARKDALGLSKMNRGYSDRNIFMAMTTNPKVAEVKVKQCGRGRQRNVCKEYKQRWTYAIPLEIIFHTPLGSWNPYDIEYHEDRTIPSANARNGRTKEKAYDGNAHHLYFRTPTTFYTGKSTGNIDPADTARGSVYVLDRKKIPQAVKASGAYIQTPNIPGVGQVRLRYPIAPIHADGDPVFKELEALKKMVMNMDSCSYMMHEIPSFGSSSSEDKANKVYEFKMSMSDKDPHAHSVYLDSNEIELLKAGNRVTKDSEQAAGHTHNLIIKWSGNEMQGKPYYERCDGGSRCFDNHGRAFIFVEDE